MSAWSYGRKHGAVFVLSRLLRWEVVVQRLRAQTNASWSDDEGRQLATAQPKHVFSGAESSCKAVFILNEVIILPLACLREDRL